MYDHRLFWTDLGAKFKVFWEMNLGIKQGMYQLFGLKLTLKP
jgi:hypothetical protein